MKKLTSGIILLLLFALRFLAFAPLSFASVGYYEIRVEKGDWVIYKIESFDGAMLPVEFNTSLFPNVWISLNENSSIFVEVLDKAIISPGNYSREFAIINATVNGQPVIPFWFFEKINMTKSLPLDGCSPFMPVNESFWNDFEELINFWKGQLIPYGFQLTYQVQKCFYRLRAEHLLMGWVEVFANYDEYYGVLKEFSVAFVLTSEFVHEINSRISTIIVDNEPFQLEAGKLYRIKIIMADTNIPGLVNSVEFGSKYAEVLDRAIEEGVVGMVITVKPFISKNETLSRIDVLSQGMNTLVSASKDKIRVEIDSTVSVGKVLVININFDVFPLGLLEELTVFFDGEKLPRASDYEDAANPSDDEGVEYFVLTGTQFIQVVITIPHFSTHIVEIVKTPSPLIIYLLVSIVVACVILLFLARKRIRKNGEN